MVFFNYTTMQASAKIVYYGPGLCGKTTNLLHIHKKTAAVSRGEMVSLETDTDRTLFFDLLPLEVGQIGGMRVRIQLYTVPGQVFYNATRKLVLRGVDGIVFVADSQEAAFDANLESFRSLEDNLREMGLSLDSVPLVFQYNKRDLRSSLPIEDLDAALNTKGRSYFEAAALHGLGVFETLKAISKLALGQIHEKMAKPEDDAPPPTIPLAPIAAPLEFAAASDSTTALKPVGTRAPTDIHRELEALRALALGKAPPQALTMPLPQIRPEARLDELVAATDDGRLEVRRRAVVDVPPGLLKPGASVRVQVIIDGPDGPVTSSTGIEVRLPAGRRTDRVILHADVELKSK